MATIFMYAYPNRDNRENLYLTQTISTVVDGEVVRDTKPIDVEIAEKISLIIREDGVVNPPTITVDTDSHPQVFEPQPNGVLHLRLGKITQLEVGKTYQARLVIYDDDQNQDGVVIADFSENTATDTLRIRVR